MKTETKEVKIYVADDGKKFLDPKECIEYEKNVSIFRGNMRYFRLDWNPDLTETGLMCESAIVAVYSKDGLWEDILTWYAICQKNLSLIGPSVMGFGLQRHFTTRAVDPKLGLHWKDLIILAPESILEDPQLKHFLPENCDRTTTFDYVKGWGLKC